VITEWRRAVSKCNALHCSMNGFYAELKVRDAICVLRIHGVEISWIYLSSEV
jgi:hypothetical protein